jgi:hypothetical protein
VKVCFDCPACERSRGVVNLTGPTSWTCPACHQAVPLTPPPTVTGPEGTTLQACAACGNAELSKKKDFPHWLGVAILAVACVAFLLLNAWYQTGLAWLVLIGSAVIDGLLYLTVRDVVVCYHCEAQHRGPRRSGNAPFELTIHERYRQQKLRKEQLNK